MPSAKTTIVCLANSRKLNGRCVAGIRWTESARNGKWIRPISQFGSGELKSERFYAGDKEPKLLDLVQLSVTAPRPHGCHTEDHLNDYAVRWSRVGSVTFDQLVPFAKPATEPLWINGKSTRNGENDSIPADEAESLSSSLTLIRPNSVTLVATLEGMERPKRKVRGHFKFGRHRYVLSVTDPLIEEEFARCDVDTEREIVSPLLCISISEVFEKQNACYKLIAGVIEET